ncbi:MAG: efflux RND transporter periplasmic adaptor subunit [Ardenticatenaceae bacterium]
MLKRIILLVGVLLLGACSPSDESLGEEPTPIPTSVVPSKPTYKVKLGDVVSQVEFFGRIAPVVETSLTFPMAGQVGEVYVKRGAFVEAGDPIASLDTQELEKELALSENERDVATQRLEAIQSQLATDRGRAELNVAMGQLNLDFAGSQVGEEPTPEESYQIAAKEIELELAQLALDEINNNIDPLLQADIDQAALKVAELEATIEKTKIVAPSDGHITSLDLSLGQTVKAGQAIGTIADITLLEVNASLRENVLEQMAENMAATITINNRPSDEFLATVRRLPPPYGSSASNAEFEETDESTRIAFDNTKESESFDLGERVEVVVVVTRREDTLWLPPAAIRTFNGRHFVVIQEGGGQRRIDVEIGTEGKGRVEITAGVEKGQTVIGP